MYWQEFMCQKSCIEKFLTDDTTFSQAFITLIFRKKHEGHFLIL